MGPAGADSGTCRVGALTGLEFTLWTRCPPRGWLVGDPEEGPQKDQPPFEFFRDGTMEVHLQEKKKKSLSKSRSPLATGPW